jgi:hypothetical protein
MTDFDRELLRLLQEAGCRFVRPGKGSHQIWYSPLSKRNFPATHGELGSQGRGFTKSVLGVLDALDRVSARQPHPASRDGASSGGVLSKALAVQDTIENWPITATSATSSSSLK